MNTQRSAVLIIATVATTLAHAACAAAQDEFAADAARLTTALDLTAGLSIADIGAGAGELAVALARVVGPTGRVYATELEAGRLRAIRRAADSARLKNVTVLEAHATRTNLPDRCCDALVLRNVYHHIENPVLMNRSLYQSLKPGGRLAIIDFPPDSAESANPAQRSDGAQHGVTPSTVVRELRQAGFESVAVDSGTRRRGFMVVMRRPSAAGAALAAPAAPAQDTPPGFRAEFFHQFDQSMAKIIALAEEIPADTYARRPVPAVMPIARMLAHIAHYNYEYPARAMGISTPAGIDRDTLERVAAKPAVVALLRGSAEHVRRVVRQMPEAQLSQLTTLYGRRVPQWAVLLQLIAHMDDHLGQTIAYARVSGVVPPWSQ